MILGKEHLPIWIPSEQQLADLVDSRAPVVRQLYLDTRVLVLETLPDVECSVDTDDARIGYGAHQYGYDGWGWPRWAPRRDGPPSRSCGRLIWRTPTVCWRARGRGCGP